jgi:serine/threonine protein kinase
MAPELLLEGHLDVKSSRQAQSGQSRQPRYNPRAVDVWALGVMLYLLVTGMYPFEVGLLKKLASHKLRLLLIQTHAVLQCVSITARQYVCLVELLNRAVQGHTRVRRMCVPSACLTRSGLDRKTQLWLCESRPNHLTAMKQRSLPDDTVFVCLQDPGSPGNVTATLRNIMHGKMQSIPAFVSPACAEVIKKALSRHPKMRITLDELASNAWVRTKAAEFERQLMSGSAARLPFVSHLPAIYGSHADMTAQQACTGQHAQGRSAQNGYGPQALSGGAGKPYG